MASRCSTARRFSSMATHARGEHADWGTLIFNYGRNEVRNFLVANGLVLAGLLPHRRAASGRGGVDALPGLFAQGRGMGAQCPRRTREPGGGLLSSSASTRFRVRRSFPGVMTIAEESTSVARRQPPDVPRRPRLRLQVEHGLDERFSLRYMELDPIHRRYPSERHHFLAGLRLQRSISSSSSATTRWSTARNRCWRKCPATIGRSSPICECSWRGCGRTPARSCSSRAVNSGSARNGPMQPQPRLAPAPARSVARRPAPAWCSTSTISTSHEPAFYETRRQPTRASSGSTSATPTTA